MRLYFTKFSSQHMCRVRNNVTNHVAGTFGIFGTVSVVIRLKLLLKGCFVCEHPKQRSEMIKISETDFVVLKVVW